MGRGWHTLILTDRGLNHRHRWTPSCACGKWIGVHRRRKKEAVEEYRDHVTAATRRSSAYGRQFPPVPQPVTPPEDWPDAWRCPPVEAASG